MTRKFEEDSEDLRLRLFLQYGRDIVSSLEVGDYITVKYGKILQHLSKDEIIAAHLERTLEDEIRE